MLLPASIQSGDLLIALFSGYSTSAAVDVNWPGGWTEFFETDASSTASLAVAGAYRRATGSEGGSITVTTNVSVLAAHNTYRISGAANPTAQVPEAYGTGAITSGTTINPPLLTPTGGAKDYLWLAVAGWRDTTPVVNTDPTNYTNPIEASSAGGTSGTKLRSLRRQLNASSEDPAAFALNVASDRRIRVTIAVHPDTTPPTPNPMTFATAPANDSATQISMTATTASDPSTPICLPFHHTYRCGSNGGTGGTSSSWQSSTSYSDSGLQANKCYGYTVTGQGLVAQHGHGLEHFLHLHVRQHSGHAHPERSYRNHVESDQCRERQPFVQPDDVFCRPGGDDQPQRCHLAQPVGQRFGQPFGHRGLADRCPARCAGPSGPDRLDHVRCQGEGEEPGWGRDSVERRRPGDDTGRLSSHHRLPLDRHQHWDALQHRQRLDQHRHDDGHVRRWSEPSCAHSGGCGRA